MILVCLVFASTMFITTDALNCVVDGSTTNYEYFNGVITGASSHEYSYGFVACSANLNRCASFTSMKITDFVLLDAGKDGSAFATMVQKSEGDVAGRCCMSQADVDKIKAVQSDKCDPSSKTSCYCTTDQCTGSAGGVMTMISLLTVLIYSISDK